MLRRDFFFLISNKFCINNFLINSIYFGAFYARIFTLLLLLLRLFSSFLSYIFCQRRNERIFAFHFRCSIKQEENKNSYRIFSELVQTNSLTKESHCHIVYVIVFGSYIYSESLNKPKQNHEHKIGTNNS